MQFLNADQHGKNMVERSATSCELYCLEGLQRTSGTSDRPCIIMTHVFLVS